MGIKLVEEVMDWCPDDLTPTQRWCLTVLARDANDATRETWHGPEHPEILRRVRMAAKKWEAMRSFLLKRGLLEPVSGGYRGKTVRYRIASMFAPCLIQDWRKTPLERGAFGGYAVKGERKDPLNEGGQSEPKTPQNQGGNQEKDPPNTGGPTPLLSSSTSSPLPFDRSTSPAASGEREKPAAPNNNQTAPVVAAWQAARGGRRNPAAEKQIASTAAELLLAGWTIDDLTALAVDMAAKYPTGRDLTRHADHWQPPKAAAPKPDSGAGLAAPCQNCEAAHPASRFNPRLRTTPAGDPCPSCHPDAAPLAA